MRAWTVTPRSRIEPQKRNTNAHCVNTSQLWFPSKTRNLYYIYQIKRNIIANRVYEEAKKSVKCVRETRRNRIDPQNATQKHIVYVLLLFLYIRHHFPRCSRFFFAMQKNMCIWYTYVKIFLPCAAIPQSAHRNKQHTHIQVCNTKCIIKMQI